MSTDQIFLAKMDRNCKPVTSISPNAFRVRPAPGGSGPIALNGLAAQNSTSFGVFTIRPDGKLLIAGALGEQPAVWRVHPDGSLDRGFGQGGVVISRFSPWPSGGPPPPVAAHRLFLPAILSSGGCTPVG